MNSLLIKKVGTTLVLLATFFFVSLMLFVDTSFVNKGLSSVIEEKHDVFAKKLSTINDAPPVWMVGSLSKSFNEYNEYVVSQKGIDVGLSSKMLDELKGDAENYTSDFIDESLEKDSWRSQTLKDYSGWMMEKEWREFSEFEVAFLSKVKDLNQGAVEEYGISKDRQSGMKLNLMMIGAPDFLKTGWWALAIFGLAFLGSMIAFLPLFQLKPGIHNNHIFHRPATSGKGSAWIVLGALVLFYIGLYKFPAYLANQAVLLDPLSKAMSGGASSQWFLYGFLYTFTMLIMGIRMMVKYRGNKYQQVRTTSVFFFQVAFAFTLPQILTRLQLPAYDVKSIWPLEYTFFFDYRVDEYLASGTLGLFLMFWGIILFVIGVPVLTYIYGKRWYCSWVCGCGGLAETVGDPYRQLSDKSLGAWKFERYIIHGVLVFAVLMTIAVAYTAFSGEAELLGVNSYNIRDTYGFFIGFIFAGAIGTGFYPKLGNRVWCRFGCPLAAYLGLVQRFKSRFRITTNGGQCISCGNCSTYCEMGIDVRWYAQRGQNIVRSSCVGCGVCSAVCPRGVLKLENAGTEGRINDNPILIGRDGVELNM